MIGWGLGNPKLHFYSQKLKIRNMWSIKLVSYVASHTLHFQSVFVSSGGRGWWWRPNEVARCLRGASEVPQRCLRGTKMREIEHWMGSFEMPRLHQCLCSKMFTEAHGVWCTLWKHFTQQNTCKYIVYLHFKFSQLQLFTANFLQKMFTW